MVQTSSIPKNETRFEFGENWSRFLALVDDARMAEAEKSLQDLLGLPSLSGKLFLDIGCGSGLFSLAAARLGATVHSFDYDLQSVACARELRQRYFPGSREWKVEQGSILDEAYTATLGTHDVVYSWGVLHHTGALWKAIASAARLVKPQGLFAIAIYNDQGLRSKGWRLAKATYNKLPRPLRPIFVGLFFPALWGPALLRDLFKGQPFRTWRTYASHRGMSPWRDVVDWVGGLPFEVAAPQAVIDFCQTHGLESVRLIRRDGLGCNEFVFRRIR